LVEDIWAIVQYQVHLLGCKTLIKFKENINMLIKTCQIKPMNNVNEGMRSRVADCIENNGDKAQFQGVVPSIYALPLDIGLQRVSSHSFAKWCL
jgi:hypothetical protein